MNQIIFLNLFRKWKALTSLSQIELDIIAYGMDKKDYRVYCDCPRWYDLERIAKEVIEFKKLYPGWILERLDLDGQYDGLPPTTYYKYIYIKLLKVIL